MIIYLLMVFIVFIASILIFLFIYLVINKSIIIIKNYLISKYSNDIYPYINMYISGQEPKIPRVLLTKEKWKQDIIIDLLINKTLNIKSNEEKLRVNYLSKIIGLTNKLKIELLSNKVWIVTDATRKIGRLRIQELAPIIYSNLSSTEYDLWTASARALSVMGKKDLLVKFLINNENKLTKWSVIRINDFLNTGENEHIDIMLENVDKVSPLLRNIFIETFGKRKIVVSLPIIEEYIYSNNIEERIKALKAIGDIGITTRGDRIIDILENGNWTEKLMAIYAIQSCYIRKAVPLLIDLISDNNWWIRLRSAEALFNFGQIGLEKLKWTSLYHDDKYARDMAAKVLQDKKIGVIS